MRDAKKHAQRRKIFARPFSKIVLRSTWEPVVRDKIQLMISQIQKDLATLGVCDIFKWPTFLATDVSAHLMFGESFGMLQREGKNDNIRILESVIQGSGILSELPFSGCIVPYIPLRSVQEMFGNGEALLRYGQSLLNNSRSNSEFSRNIFTGLLHASQKDGASFNDIDVAIEAGNLIVAGSDTTAVTLTYLIWAILSRPKIHTQLKIELATLRENWEESDLESLSLLNATITETLRLYGSAPGALPRSVPEGGVTFSGYYIPGGMTVTTQSWTIHRDPVLFPNPEEFDPSRWLPGVNQASEQARLAMSPFGSGSRTCLGIHLSWMELRLATAEFFLQCGNVKLAPRVTEESMKPKHFFLIAPSAHKCEITLAI
ncbi:sterigmatocystin biosynthesis P450 monooxygenase [Penicillium sp. IBT 35674x]|nr:sterigmatocystin biosynthesis P450 monooxygenase [Penicillium sp. IBT 35674x]